MPFAISSSAATPSAGLSSSKYCDAALTNANCASSGFFSVNCSFAIVSMIPASRRPRANTSRNLPSSTLPTWSVATVSSLPPLVNTSLRTSNDLTRPSLMTVPFSKVTRSWAKAGTATSAASRETARNRDVMGLRVGLGGRGIMPRPRRRDNGTEPPEVRCPTRRPASQGRARAVRRPWRAGRARLRGAPSPSCAPPRCRPGHGPGAARRSVRPPR